jgi:hypothetical protein
MIIGDLWQTKKGERLPQDAPLKSLVREKKTKQGYRETKTISQTIRN